MDQSSDKLTQTRVSDRDFFYSRISRRARGNLVAAGVLSAPAPDFGTSLVSANPLPHGRLGILVNQHAGRVARTGRPSFEKSLRRAGLWQGTELLYCDGADLAVQARELARQGIDAIAVWGGDGSAHAVIEAVDGLSIPVLPLPGGTMNRLCHRVHGHSNLGLIMERTARARPIWLSGGRANTHLFFVAAGFGPLMEFGLVREIARKAGLDAAIKSLQAMRHGFFDGRLNVLEGPHHLDVVIVAPGQVDSAFGLGTIVGQQSVPQGLEFAAARLSGLGATAALGYHVLAKSWRNLKNVKTNFSTSTAVHLVQSGSTCGSQTGICGLMDGELRYLGQQVSVEFDPYAALVLTTQ